MAGIETQAGYTCSAVTTATSESTNAYKITAEYCELHRLINLMKEWLNDTNTI